MKMPDDYSDFEKEQKKDENRFNKIALVIAVIISFFMLMDIIQ
jgi:hypothetical protein